VIAVPPKSHPCLARQASLQGVNNKPAGRVHRRINPSNLESTNHLNSPVLAGTIASTKALTLKRPSEGQGAGFRDPAPLQDPPRQVVAAALSAPHSRVPHSSRADQHRRPSVTPTLLLILGAAPCDAKLTSESAAISVGALLRMPTR